MILSQSDNFWALPTIYVDLEGWNSRHRHRQRSSFAKIRL